MGEKSTFNARDTWDVLFSGSSLPSACHPSPQLFPGKFDFAALVEVSQEVNQEEKLNHISLTLPLFKLKIHDIPWHPSLIVAL